MARLLIQFQNEELADFRWANIDEAEQSADIAWQQASDDQLPIIASQYPNPIILILPQHNPVVVAKQVASLIVAVALAT